MFPVGLRVLFEHSGKLSGPICGVLGEPAVDVSSTQEILQAGIFHEELYYMDGRLVVYCCRKLYGHSHMPEVIYLLFEEGEFGQL